MMLKRCSVPPRLVATAGPVEVAAAAGEVAGAGVPGAGPARVAEAAAAEALADGAAAPVVGFAVLVLLLLELQPAAASAARPAPGRPMRVIHCRRLSRRSAGRDQ